MPSRFFSARYGCFSVLIAPLWGDGRGCTVWCSTVGLPPSLSPDLAEEAVARGGSRSVGRRRSGVVAVAHDGGRVRRVGPGVGRGLVRGVVGAGAPARGAGCVAGLVH